MTNIYLEQDYLNEMERRARNKKYQSFYSIEEMESKINFDASLEEKRDVELYVLEPTGQVYMRVNKPVTHDSARKIQEIQERYVLQSFCSPETLEVFWHEITHVLQDQDRRGGVE